MRVDFAGYTMEDGRWLAPDRQPVDSTDVPESVKSAVWAQVRAANPRPAREARRLTVTKPKGANEGKTRTDKWAPFQAFLIERLLGENDENERLFQMRETDPVPESIEEFAPIVNSTTIADIAVLLRLTPTPHTSADPIKFKTTYNMVCTLLIEAGHRVVEYIERPRTWESEGHAFPSAKVFKKVTA